MKTKSILCLFCSILLSMPLVAMAANSASSSATPAPISGAAPNSAFQVSDFLFGAPTTTKLSDVALSETVKVSIGGKPIELKRVTAGLRRKKVAIIWASVYAAQFFSNGQIDLTSVSSLRDSFIENLPVALSMTFVRGVGIEKIVDAYREVLNENGIKSDAEPYAKFLEGVKASGDVKDTQTYWFLFSKNGAQEQISFQTNGKEYFSWPAGSAGTIKNFLSMWLAKPTDSGLEKLQEQFTQKDKK